MRKWKVFQNDLFGRSVFNIVLGVSLLMFSALSGNIEFSHHCEEKFFDQPLHPAAKPREEGFLKVSEIHSIFYALYGNPDGIPVVVLHGGPGGGCSDTMAQVFDLTQWNVVMFDQRGALRSKPFGCMEENTPQHLVSDIEALKKHLGLNQWVLYGGSWGSALALLYGQSYPESCLGFILRGVCLARESDYLHLFYGMGKTFPEAHRLMVDFIPEEERNDLLSAYHRRVFDPNPEVQLLAARTFMNFDAICATHLPNPKFVEKMTGNDQLVLGVMKTFCHYAKNKFFLEPNQILSQMNQIAHLPAIVVQGRYDTITPPEIAYTLYENWPNSLLWIVPNAGHSGTDLSSGIMAAADLFMQKIQEKASKN